MQSNIPLIGHKMQVEHDPQSRDHRGVASQRLRNGRDYIHRRASTLAPTPNWDLAALRVEVQHLEVEIPQL